MHRAGVLILLRDPSKRIAWQLRDDDPGVPTANSWGIFGGWIEPGESRRAAAIREVKEELSVELDPSQLDYLGVFEIYPEVNAYVYSYLILDGLREAVLHEGQAFAFLSAAEWKG
ncbi:MAG: NUDIX domain-containing protein [Anaerolineales bacterium]|nr:NUDIX domain-containing protein [Anaerolineales bacterium]